MERHIEILAERFGGDSLIALATVDEAGIPWSRTINAVFAGNSFYSITCALSKKMEHIKSRATVAVSGDWFSGHALGENLGHIGLERNRELAEKLKAAFASWYGNGHTDEDDPNTVILRLRLTDGIIFDHGTRHEF